MTLGNQRVDVLFACLVTASWACLLLVPYGESFAGTDWWVWRAAALTLVVLLAVLWSRRAPRVRPPQAPRSAGHEVLAWLMLLAVAITAFGEPMKLDFWVGWDEFGFIQRPEAAKEWVAPSGGRPLLSWPLQMFGLYVSGGRVEAFLWLATLLWFGNGLLLRSIVRRLTGSTLLGTLSGALLLVNRAEPLRFMAMSTALYYLLPLLLFLSAVALWLRSYERSARGGLVLSCALLTAALLMTEGLFPLAAAVPILAWRRTRETHRYGVWVGCWYGLVGVLTIKFVHYLAWAGVNSYQSQQLRAALVDPAVLAASLSSKMAAIRAYGVWCYPWDRWAIAFWAAALAAGGALAFALHLGKRPPRGRVLALTFVGALGAYVLAVLPFLHLESRVQFLSGPAQAVVLACVLVVPMLWMPPRAGALALVVLTGFLCGASAKRSFRDQTRPGPVLFERVVRVFEQVHALAPRFEPDTVVLFLPESDEARLSVLNYHVWYLSQVTLGTGAIQAGVQDYLGDDPAVTDAGYRIRVIGRALAGDVVSWDRLVGFHLGEDGTVRLAESLPHPAPGYDPLARLRPGAAAPLRFLRLPSWMHHPDDIVHSLDGVVFGTEWSARGGTEGSGSIWREAPHGATLFVNAPERTRLVVTVEPRAAGSFLLRGPAGVASTGANELHEERIDLPASPDRLTRVRIECPGLGEAVRVTSIRREALGP